MNQPLRVLQIVPSISLVYGGPSQMVLGFSQALANAGVEVTILTTDSNGDIGQPSLNVPLNQPVACDGYWIRYFHSAPFRRYKFSLGLFQWLITHAHEFDIAHIHALFSPVSSVAAAIARFRSLPYVLRPLGTLDPADLRKKRRIKQIYAAILERPNLAGAAAIHFTSLQEARISDRFKTQTLDWVIPLGVTLPKPIPNPHSVLTASGIMLPDQNIPVLLYMSRIDPKKGLDLLFPALEHLVKEGHLFHFVLAGGNSQDPAYIEQINQQIQSSLLAPRTTITGFVSGDCKMALLQQADLFVLPSYYENFGIAVAEAMAAGTPVVISDQVHICSDVKQSESGWISPCDHHLLTDQLREALTNPTERQRRGQNAHHFAKTQYSWGAIAQQTLQSYKKILEQV